MHPVGRCAGVPAGVRGAECPPICRVHSGLVPLFTSIYLSVNTWAGDPTGAECIPTVLESRETIRQTRELVDKDAELVDKDADQ